MSLQNIIREAINKDPLAMKEALSEELKNRLSVALDARIGENLDENNGLWANIHARREKGLPRKKPGEKGYPKTLNIEEETEDLSEISKDTLIKYALKAYDRGDMASRMSKSGADKEMATYANKRYHGVKTAIKKLSEK